MVRRRPVIALVVLLLFAGCGGGTGPAGSTAGTPTPAAPPPVTATTPTLTASPTPGPTPPPTTTSTPTPRGPQQGTEWTVTVTRVIDGDTVEARFPNGAIDTLRLLGVDTPETTLSAVSPEEYEGLPASVAGREHLYTWGQKAAAFATAELAGRTVRIAVDPRADRRGSFGRLLVYLYVDGTNFNKRLLTEGYARLYESSFSKRDQFAAAETTARANDVGLWGFEQSTPTPTPRPSTLGGGELTVATIHADAEGNDHENPNDEYIVFENTGGHALALGGWTVSDAAGHTYTVPAGVTLAAGAQVTLHTGSGTDSATALYWGSDGAIWNNGGDTIVVENATGAVVLRREYG